MKEYTRKLRKITAVGRTRIIVETVAMIGWYQCLRRIVQDGKWSNGFWVKTILRSLNEFKAVGVFFAQELFQRGLMAYHTRDAHEYNEQCDKLVNFFIKAILSWLSWWHRQHHFFVAPVEPLADYSHSNQIPKQCCTTSVKKASSGNWLDFSRRSLEQWQTSYCSKKRMKHDGL